MVFLIFFLMIYMVLSFFSVSILILGKENIVVVVSFLIELSFMIYLGVEEIFGVFRGRYR